MKTRQYINALCILCLLSTVLAPIDAQDLGGCPPSEIFNLNSGVVNVGNGEIGCGCSSKLTQRGNCRLIGISLTDTVRQAYSCYGILLNSQNPYIDYFDVYSTRTCRKYEPISPVLPTRYFLDVGRFPPGSVLEVLVCSNDNADMKIDLTATPSGICRESPCSVGLLCPEDRTLKPTPDECAFIVGDYRGEVEIIDTCDVMLEDYFIEQSPAPGELIYEDSEVTFTLYVDTDDSRAYVARCAMNLSVILDTIPPNIFVDDIEQSTIACFESLPALESYSVDDDNVTVVASINEYEVDRCNGYTVLYKWEATDPCGNVSKVVREYSVLPDLTPPTLDKVPAEIVLEVNANCAFFGVVPIVKATDDCSPDHDLLIKLYDGSGKFVRELTKDIKLDSAEGYVVYEVSDDCGNIFRDTSKIKGIDIEMPVIECLDNLSYIVSPVSTCEVTADWSVPSVTDNCNGITMTQVKGPQPGDLLGAGEYEVVYEAIDNFGNISQCAFNIFVKQESLESFTCVGINYSVDQSCSSDLLYEAIYEHNGISCTDKFSITLVTKGGIVIPDEYFSEYVGETIEYELCYEDRSNCCVAEVTIEDKLSPVISCNDQVIDCWEEVSDYLPEVYNECKPVSWEIVEDIVSEDCTTGGSQRILRRQYTAIDLSGNRSEPCVQEITINILSLDDLINAEDLVDARDTIFSCDQYDTFAEGKIFINGPLFKGQPINLIADSAYCQWIVTYEDQILTNILCEKKILRRWSISTSHCSKFYETVDFTQFISFRDTLAPIAQLPQSRLTYSTNIGTCEAWISLPKPIVSDNCTAGEDIDIRIIGNRELDYHQGLGINLSVGEHQIIYEIQDQCYNTSYDTLIIDIIDKNAPVAICLEYTVVSLSQGSAWLYGTDLNVSSYDDCDDIDSFLVRRMDIGCSIADTAYSESVSFCCQDIGQSIPVMLRVKDHSDNWNECMVIVDVQDKSIPEIICLPDFVLDCSAHALLIDDSAYDDLLGVYQSNSASRQKISIPNDYIISHTGDLLDGLIDGFCDGLTTTQTIEKNVNNCGIGSVRRIFKIRKADGQLLQTCVQNISFENDFDKENYVIDWPKAEINLSDCLDFETVSNQFYGEPVLAKEIACSLFGTSYSDELYSVDTTVQSQICYKLKRTWQVIDWCNQEDDYLNSLEFVQWIYVYQSDPAPEYRNVKGHVYVASGETMFDVNLELTDRTAQEIYRTYTDQHGAYAFNDMIASSQYNLRPSYDDIAITGVTSFDLLLLQKHILGIESLKTPNEIIAGDVNRDGVLSSFDLVQMRSLILGQTTDWPNSESWRFYDRSIDFSLVEPLSLDVDGSIFIEENPTINEFDFTAIKVGDISGSKSNSKSTKTSQSKSLVKIQDKRLTEGQLYNITIDIAELNYSALQLGLIADPSKVRFVKEEESPTPVGCVVSENSYRALSTELDHDHPDHITFRLMAQEDVLLSEAISLDYDYSGLWERDKNIAKRLELYFEENHDSNHQLIVYPNYPNPFTDHTSIPISLYSDHVVTMVVMDAFGALLVKETYELGSGDHTLSVYDEQLTESGIYYLTIGTSQQSVTKKLVFIKK